MNTRAASLAEVIAAITSAFAGVQLAEGSSIGQAEVMDRYGEGCTNSEFAALPLTEITNDWSRIQDGELERALVAHFDALGYRYYIPALTLSIIRNYDLHAMRVIGTISSLCPFGDSRQYRTVQYSELSRPQLNALALFVERLPGLVNLCRDDAMQLERALCGYWKQYIQST